MQFQMNNDKIRLKRILYNPKKCIRVISMLKPEQNRFFTTGTRPFTKRKDEERSPL